MDAHFVFSLTLVLFAFFLCLGFRKKKDEDE